MKRLLVFVSLVFIMFIIYYDITSGTLPQKSSTHSMEPSLPVNQSNPKSNLKYIEVTMKPGDTLLSIIEREEGSLTQPIEDDCY